jgi:hypothetical protein
MDLSRTRRGAGLVSAWGVWVIAHVVRDRVWVVRATARLSSNNYYLRFSHRENLSSPLRGHRIKKRGRSAPAPRGPFLLRGQKKWTKEKAARMAQALLRVAALGPALPRRGILPRESGANILFAPLRALTQSLTMLAMRHTGGGGDRTATAKATATTTLSLASLISTREGARRPKAKM